MIEQIDFEKSGGLVPAIIQDEVTGKVLMLGYMNQAAYQQTIATKRVTFYSRKRQTLWTKGETSGNFLTLKSIALDCDGDTLLIKVTPTGPTCHTGADTCFKESNVKTIEFLTELEEIIDSRKKSNDPNSYTSNLFKQSLDKIAQKVGEEAVEVVIEAVGNKKNLLNESADLIFHFLVLLKAHNLSLKDVSKVLETRHTSK